MIPISADDIFQIEKLALFVFYLEDTLMFKYDP